MEILELLLYIGHNFNMSYKLAFELLLSREIQV